MNYLTALTIAAATALAGCGHTAPKNYDIKQTEFTFVIVPYATTEDFKGKRDDIKGEASFRPGYCKITLRNYPMCLQHELRHCIEGNWHEGRKTTEDCHE